MCVVAAITENLLVPYCVRVPGGGRLVDRFPEVPAHALATRMVPPPHFSAATFGSYLPDPQYGTQTQVHDYLLSVVGQVRCTRHWWQHHKLPLALYLDGGFGVGKTHLLAALVHAVGVERARFGTFMQYTHLVGATGFESALDLLSQAELVAIDEFELDDPGDTLLITRLVRCLSDRGVTVAVTSNTLPEALGQGRFAADDFVREIQDLADRFVVLRIDGPDFRNRAVAARVDHLDGVQVKTAVDATPGATLDSFAELLKHLSCLHPSRYQALVQSTAVVGLVEVQQIVDQDVALRFVVLVDRLYDQQVPVLWAWDSFEQTAADDPERLFGGGMLAGGYRKKYLRTLSRLTELTAAGAALAAQI